jgi:hypothetical protein
MKDLKFICVQPDDAYYTWQTHLWIESLKEIGQSDKAIILVFTPNFRKPTDRWDKLVELYPESEFVFYTDDDNISKHIPLYIPILRPYSLMRYFRDHLEMEHKAVLYCDCDVIFTKDFNIDAYVDDDINYLSDTNSYINASYFDSKVKDVLPEKLHEYEAKDILTEATALVGITRQIAEANNEHSGGAQYLLKNIDYKFWESIIGDCIQIRTYLQSINRTFFESESTGFQSWCADMWAILWRLWQKGRQTKNIKEMEFAWSSDSIEKLNHVGILHNAGIVSNMMEVGKNADGVLISYPAFYKGLYHNGKDPFTDPHLQEVLNSDESKKRCTHHYVKKMFELKEKYNLNY